jgi:hypothetical protein
MKKTWIIKDTLFKRYTRVYEETENQALSVGSSILGTCRVKIIKGVLSEKSQNFINKYLVK